MFMKKKESTWCWNNWISTGKKPEPRYRQHALPKTKLKWITDLGCGRDVLDVAPKM